jgi:hypothetical protein
VICSLAFKEVEVVRHVPEIVKITASSNSPRWGLPAGRTVPRGQVPGRGLGMKRFRAKVFDFGRDISSDDAVAAMKKEKLTPEATLASRRV